MQRLCADADVMAACRFLGQRGKAWVDCHPDQHSRMRYAATLSAGSKQACAFTSSLGVAQLHLWRAVPQVAMSTGIVLAGLRGWVRPGTASPASPSPKMHQACGWQVRTAGASGCIWSRPIRHQWLQVQGKRPFHLDACMLL